MDETERLQVEQIRHRLQSLPPDLADPVDRCERIGERVQRQRRRQTAAAVGGVVVAVALSVPVATQLLPETAEITPGGGVVETSGATDTHAPDGGYGGTEVTHLSVPVTITGTGTMTVELGDRPEGASGVGMVLDCLSPGDFTYPDGAGMICDSADAGTELTGAEDFESAAYVVSLPEDAEEIEIRATEGSSWRLTASYVSTEVTAWGVNAKGETFGVENINGSPDLIAVFATNGETGYAYVTEMNAAWGPQPTSPEHALQMQEERAGQMVSVPVYQSDGETEIGEFVMGGTDDPARLGDEVTVTTGP